MLEVFTEGHFGPVLATLLVDGIGGVGFLSLIAFGLLHARVERRRAARADSEFDPVAPLAPGEAVVAGLVEYAPERELAFRVEITQSGGENESSGSWSHTWREVDRVVSVAPFYLARAGGDRVRVEAIESAMLVDDLDGIVRIDHSTRRRVAELTPGEHVYVFGELRQVADPEARPGAGYRAPPRGFVLGPPRKGNMLLSSQQLGARFLKRAATHKMLVTLVVIAASLFHLIVLPFHIRRWFGENAAGIVTSKEIIEGTDDEGDPVYTHVVHLTVNGLPLEEDVAAEDHRGIQPGQRLAVRYVPALPEASALGPAGTIHGASLMAASILVGMWFLYRGVLRGSRPWYERPVIDSGSGRLSESKP